MTPRPVLYLLPGLLCDASVWVAQTAALRDVAEVRTPDFLGHRSIGSMADRVLAEAPARFAVVGHSMGARVALEIVRLAPERVERLALLDTGTHPRRPGEAEQRQVLVDLARREGMAALAARWLPPMVHPRHTSDGPLMAGLRAMVQRASPEDFAGQVQALLDRPDAEAGLAAIRCPVLVAVGREDAWSPPAQHEAMARRILHAQYVVFENSGHMAPLEAPEDVSRALLDWMAAPVPGPAAAI